MKRIIELDVLRVLALLFVIFHHTTWWFVDRYPVFIKDLDFFYLGDLGVSFFIILSGCALTLSGNKNYSLSTFYKKRFLSIIPSYWVAYLVITILLFIINGTFFQDFQLKKFAVTLFGLDGWLGTAGFNTYYRVGEWFTGFILLVYAIAPLVIFLVRKKPTISVIVFTIVSYLSIHFNDVVVHFFRVWSHNPFWNPTARLAEFSVGVLLGLLILNNKIINQRFYFLFFSGIAAGLLLFLAHRYYDGLRYLYYISLFIFLFVAFNLVRTSLSHHCRLKNVLKEFIPALTFFSSLSFLAFLYHHQLILLLIQRLPIGSSQNVTTYGFLICSVFCLSYFLAYVSLPLVNEVKRISKSILLGK